MPIEVKNGNSQLVDGNTISAVVVIVQCARDSKYVALRNHNNGITHLLCDRMGDSFTPRASAKALAWILGIALLACLLWLAGSLILTVFALFDFRVLATIRFATASQTLLSGVILCGLTAIFWRSSQDLRTLESSTKDMIEHI